MDALQQKFSSRMRIMEDTNKSLHSQLVLARRERDTHKETIASFERKLLEDRKEHDTRDTEMQRAQEKIKDMQKSLSDVQAELERANTDLRLTKEARKADQILWKIDRARGRSEKLSDEDVQAMEQLQITFRDCEKFYVGETERLTEKLKVMSQEFKKQRNAHERIVTELREHVRVLEIEQRNLSLKKDSQTAASEILEAGAAKLQQAVHLNELQRLTRKYRLSSIIDQLQFVTDPIRRSTRSDVDSNPDGIKYIINQLITIRDEDAQALVPNDDRSASIQTFADKNGYTPSLSEYDGTYDNVSQSSLSIRSVASMPVRSTVSSDTRIGIERYGRHISRRPYPDHTLEERDDDSNKGVDTDERSVPVPHTVPRTSSFEQNNENGTYPHRAGTTNILCRVRREELARGGQPSVRLMARAFEAIDNCRPPEKQFFFGMRKSRSVETTHSRQPVKVDTPSTLKHSISNVDVEEASPYATLPRGAGLILMWDTGR
ncbi:hypothetical protein NECAME_12473 [Necator americanus]|uniref:Uncharacterized protein n=1 Tax=Necator americanus TaxID=51031 RepID=W2SZZ8_NECAM|nr:hypothetical protein NECAME_12473 [Necator americanus]ETN75320.1 hypothetical protein NECAME_12473 [Necator americanus]